MINSYTALAFFSLTIFIIKPVFSQTEGFYKDLFMDGGVDLTSRTVLPAADALNLSMEFLATSDVTLQTQGMIENINDQNGCLLYPDGAPRFALIYTNGGSATNHGNSLGEEGRNRIRAFYYNGGSYTGSCAGAFIASLSYMSAGIYEPYYHIWPGRTEQPSLAATYTGHFIPQGSPLLNYYDFGSDLYISNVYHNYGCFAREDLDFPAGTEILLRYDYTPNSMHNKPSCWAYIKDEKSGRVVVIGSHPESVMSGERLDLMKAILLYALDGVAAPKVKGMLANGQSRIMGKSTIENDPAFTKIGDKQYHHFKVEIPEHSKNFSVELDGAEGFDFHLFLNKNYFAFNGDAEYSQNTIGDDKNISLQDISAGTWFVGVKCAAAVQAVKQSWGYSYSGNIGVLNGVEYSVAASWDSTASGIYPAGLPEQYTLLRNYPNPFNSKTVINYQLAKNTDVKLAIYNDLGQRIVTLVSEYQTAGNYKTIWNAEGFPSGIFFCRLETNSVKAQTRKLVLIK